MSKLDTNKISVGSLKASLIVNSQVCICSLLWHFCLPVFDANGLMMSVSGNGLVCLGVWKESPCPCVWLGVGGLQKSNDD